MEPRLLRASIDGAITRYLFAQQRNFAAEANGSALSRWATPFSMDVAFGPDGTAVVRRPHHLRPNNGRPRPALSGIEPAFAFATALQQP